MDSSTDHNEPLQGRTILLTRASHQNSRLKTMLQALGARVVAAPCVAIRFSDDALIRTRLGEMLAVADSVVFSSANAVEAAFALGARHADLSRTQLWTVGPSSRQCLQAKMGDDVDIGFPETAQGARGLLQCLESRIEHGQRFIVLRGEPSLSNIAPRLRERGAHVDELVLYCSSSITPDIDSLLSDSDITSVAAVLVSSLSALEGISKVNSAGFSELMHRGQLIAASSRIAVQARQRGWQQVYPSQEPDDASMVECLLARFGVHRSADS